MAQFVVRHLEDKIKARLQRRAARHGRSMEEEVREILRNALKNEGPYLPPGYAHCRAPSAAGSY